MTMNFAAVLGLFGALFFSAIPVHAKEAANTARFDHTHKAWADVLTRYVIQSGPQSSVRYKALKNSRSTLQGYLGEVGAVSKEVFDGFTRDQQLAFLVNAYNALTVDLILDHYPLKSIRDLGGVFSSPWKKKFFTLFGEKHSLDDIEHEMIRKHYHEPRIHFALVCASKGCPALRGEPFIAMKLDAQLDDAARAFLTDKTKNRFDSTNSTLYLSSIFKWYGDDFTKDHGSFKSFVSSRIATNPRDQERLKSDQTKVEFLEYDWSLNEALDASK